MIRVRFTSDAFYENEGRAKGTQFRAGEEYEFEDAFAQRWIRRGVAEAVQPSPKMTPINKTEIDRGVAARQADAAVASDRALAKQAEVAKAEAESADAERSATNKAAEASRPRTVAPLAETTKPPADAARTLTQQPTQTVAPSSAKPGA